MNKTLLKRIMMCLGIGLFAVIMTTDAYGQRRGKNKDGELQILKNLPDFFINDSDLPPYLQQIYKRDAARLALRLINQEQRLSKQTVEIPEELVDAVYNALVAVRLSSKGSSTKTAIDTIAETYNVRTFPVPNVETLILVFEHDAAWVEPLKNRQDTTGSPTINMLIRKHKLIMTRMVYLDEERAGLVLQSQEPLNMPALAMQFFTEEGVGSIEEVLPYGDGNDISIERTKKGWDLLYSVRFGNCVNQCQKSYDWRFSVDGDTGEVTYLGGSGDTIPPWIGPNAQGKKYPDVLKGR